MLFNIWMLLAWIVCGFCAYSGCSLIKNYYQMEEEDEERPLPWLLLAISERYLSDCSIHILYDDKFFEIYSYKITVKQSLDRLRSFPIKHGYLDKYKSSANYTENVRGFCTHFVIFCNDMEILGNVIGYQLLQKTVIVTTMTKWQIKEYLTTPLSRKLHNLLVVADPSLQRNAFQEISESNTDIDLYTHRLHIDGVGSSLPMIVTTWRGDRFTRPLVNLFPPKLEKGFSRHQFVVAAVEQPPFVFRKSSLSAEDSLAWDGLEIRMLKIIAAATNISLTIRDSSHNSRKDGAESVINDVAFGSADIGISGVYISRQYYNLIFYSFPHTEDCASFITLASSAMPKYRAILGPFQWEVWIFVICLYIFAVIPLTLTEHVSLKEMIKKARGIGTLLWSIFGVFTTCFSYKRSDMWTTSEKRSTRVVVGTYWIFTIIMMSAYSSSIISFITIPTFYEVTDTVQDLMDEDYKIGTLASRGWSHWFNNSADEITNELLQDMEIVPSLHAALKRVADEADFAFLGSKQLLGYIVQKNFTPSDERKKSSFHLTSECLCKFPVGLVLKPNADFLATFNTKILRMQQSGLLLKILRDVEWEMMRTSSGKLLKMSTSLREAIPEDRKLTVDDMQGMFLLLGIGIVAGAASLLRECYVGYKFFDTVRSYRSAISTIPSIIMTPCDSAASLYDRAASAGHRTKERVAKWAIRKLSA